MTLKPHSTGTVDTMNHRFRFIVFSIAATFSAPPALAEFLIPPVQPDEERVRAASIIVSDQGNGIALIGENDRAEVVAFARGQRQQTVAIVPGRAESATLLHTQTVMAIHYKPKGAFWPRTMLMDADGKRIALADRPAVYGVLDYDPRSGTATTLESAEAVATDESMQFVIALVDYDGARLTETRAFKPIEGGDMPRARIAVDASAAIVCLEPQGLKAGQATLLDGQRRERRDLDFGVPVNDCAIEGDAVFGLAKFDQVIELDRTGGHRTAADAVSPTMGFRQSTHGNVMLRRGLADVPSRRPTQGPLHGRLRQLEPPVLDPSGKTLSMHGRVLNEVPPEAAGDIAVRLSAADRFGEQGVMAFLDYYGLAVNISPSGESQWFEWSADIAFSPSLKFAAIRRGREVDVVPINEIRLKPDEVSRRISKRWTEMTQQGLR
ncbi:MAG: hypothetical protein IPO95_02005 [Rhodanobacteraceae bacterium]|nr:hypothetical protein [Rhodanobacteraceae bacterium]